MGDDPREAQRAADIGAARVIELPADATHRLRSSVLRDGTPSTDLVWPGDDLASTVHLGVVIGDAADPVAISTWLREQSPDAAAGLGAQLRGMATDPGVRGVGVGALLLRTGIERARADEADHVWANARIGALGFYLAHGFEVTSDEFLSADTAIAHRRILRRLRDV